MKTCKWEINVKKKDQLTTGTVKRQEYFYVAPDAVIIDKNTILVLPVIYFFFLMPCLSIIAYAWYCIKILDMPELLGKVTQPMSEIWKVRAVRLKRCDVASSNGVMDLSAREFAALGLLEGHPITSLRLLLALTGASARLNVKSILIRQTTRYGWIRQRLQDGRSD